MGTELVGAAVEEARRLGVPALFLEGSPAYYSRSGYEPAAAYGITMDLPDWAPTEAAQVLRLPAYDPAWRGHVVYPPAFDGL